MSQKQRKIVPETVSGNGTIVPTPKKRKVKVVIKKKRLETKATQIQSRWRGHQIRKTIQQIKGEKEKPLNLEETPPQTDPLLNAEEEKLETFRKIPFHELNRVQFYVDSAVGLPENCTISRVCGRLLRPDRTEVSSLGTIETFTDPRSDATNPAVDLFLSWKGSSLSSLPSHSVSHFYRSLASVLEASATILCRIDTLDRLDLSPRTVGYTALKLFVTVTEDGQESQPTSSTSLSDVFLNAGRFSLPILLGSLPAFCPLTEERIEDLPTMPGAYLIVRLFDASVESPPSQLLPPVTSEMNTCAELVYSTFDNLEIVKRFELTHLPSPPLWDTLGSEIEMGRDLAEEEWKILCPLFNQWCQRIFPLVTEMREVIDVSYSKRYSNEFKRAGPGGGTGGVVIGLDMLYNMPIPRKESKLPNSVVTYKATFQYLPGRLTERDHSTSASPPAPATVSAVTQQRHRQQQRDEQQQGPESNQEEEEDVERRTGAREGAEEGGDEGEEDPRDVVDDVSRHWDIEASTLRCPVFVDDFKTTT
jgi:hypothetical protein